MAHKMHSLNFLPSFRVAIARLATFATAVRIALVSTVLISGGANAQSWVFAEENLWNWPDGEVAWSPDEDTLADAKQKLEAAFYLAAEAASPLPVTRWNAYTLEYQGRIAGDSRLIRVVGDCDLDSRTVTREDGTKERVIVTGGGGGCLFRATYDTTTKDVIGFQFNGPY